MRILQGYVSKSVMDFPFHQIYSLDDYNNATIPSVFFGMYRFEDYQLLEFHTMFSHAVVFWTGQDVMQWDDNRLRNIHQCANSKTAHPKVYAYITSKGHFCELIKPASFLNEPKAQKLGKKIYAYCPRGAEDYHGKSVLDELRRGGYEIVVGDGQWTQDQWRNGKADEHYKDICIGLCLSSFAGGGTSIIEMGLRGIQVVTNVFELPHCKKWRSVIDVVHAIESQKKRAGTTDDYLAQRVWNELDHEHKWLEI